MTSSVVWISFSYVLAFMGQYSIAEELSKTVVTGVIFVMLPYFAKSLFETKWEKELEFRREQNQIQPENTINDNDAVG